MTDLSKTIIAKSDQLNSDDLIGRSITIKVTKVSLLDDAQPIGINYEGDEGKPYKPCKSMRRVLVSVWGSDGAKFVGRRMTLYRDPEVQFGGAKVGGIRISHLSDIKEPMTISLMASKKGKKPFTVQPLPAAGVSLSQQFKQQAELGSEAMKKFWSTCTPEQQRELAAVKEDYKKIAEQVDAKKAPAPTAQAAATESNVSFEIMGKAYCLPLNEAGVQIAESVGRLRAVGDDSAVDDIIASVAGIIASLEEAGRGDLVAKIKGE